MHTHLHACMPVLPKELQDDSLQIFYQVGKKQHVPAWERSMLCARMYALAIDLQKFIGVQEKL